MKVLEVPPVPAASAEELSMMSAALSALRRGDASVRLPLHWSGLCGRVAEAFNGVAEGNARMAAELQSRQQELQEQARLLALASRYKSEFLANMSHELRNPLAPIRNAVELICRVAPRDPRLSWARDVVERQVLHMTRLVEDLLDVARIARGEVALCRERIELSAVIEQALATTRPLIEARGHRLEVRLPAAPIWLSGDFARLAQAVAHLLNNAAKYTRDGGRIELSADARTGAAAGQEADQAVIVVRDNGIGIDAELLPRIFDIFTQGDRVLDDGQGGLGLGLTLVRQLVELHGGRVEGFSAGAERGAEFRVFLPVPAASGTSLAG